MDIFTVKLIVEAAECGSLSQVAQKYSYTPSAMSHMLTGFEKELGVRLFERRSTGIVLTEEGKILYPKLNAILKCEADLLQKAASLKKEQTGQLRIATYPSISRNLLADLLKRFREEYPGIRISVNVSDNLLGWLEKDKADIIFADSITCGENEWFPMMKDEYLAVVPVSMELEGDRISRSQLYHYPYIDTDEAILNHYFEKTEFRDRIYFHSEDDLSVIRMVQAGIGITVLPALVLKINEENIQFLRLDPPCVRTLGFACRRERRNSKVLDLFIDFVRLSASDWSN